MNPQIVCRSQCKVTLVAFVWLFCTVFSNVSSNCLPQRMKSHTKSNYLHLFKLSLLYVFKWVLKLHAWEDAYWHWLHLLNSSAMYCQLSPQGAKPRGCETTQAAFVWYLSPLCVFKCVLKAFVKKDALLHSFHFFQLDPLCLFKCIHFYSVKPLEVVTGVELPIITISF